jgi:hypothetical protein
MNLDVGIDNQEGFPEEIKRVSWTPYLNLIFLFLLNPNLWRRNELYLRAFEQRCFRLSSTLNILENISFKPAAILLEPYSDFFIDR